MIIRDRYLNNGLAAKPFDTISRPTGGTGPRVYFLFFLSRNNFLFYIFLSLFSSFAPSSSPSASEPSGTYRLTIFYRFRSSLDDDYVACGNQDFRYYNTHDTRQFFFFYFLHINNNMQYRFTVSTYNDMFFFFYFCVLDFFKL